MDAKHRFSNSSHAGVQVAVDWFRQVGPEELVRILEFDRAIMNWTIEFGGYAAKMDTGEDVLFLLEAAAEFIDGNIDDGWWTNVPIHEMTSELLFKQAGGSCQVCVHDLLPERPARVLLTFSPDELFSAFLNLIAFAVGLARPEVGR